MDLNHSKTFIITKSEMVEALLRSKVDGNSLGIWASSLGHGMFICTVKDILRDEDEEDIVIILNENELAAPLPNSFVLYLSEIERIYPLVTHSVPKENASS